MNSRQAEYAFEATVAAYDADQSLWYEDGQRNRWAMPPLAPYQRLAGIRVVVAAIRVVRLVWRAEFTWGGRVPPGFERELWEAYGLWKGLWHD